LSIPERIAWFRPPRPQSVDQLGVQHQEPHRMHVCGSSTLYAHVTHSCPVPSMHKHSRPWGQACGETQESQPMLEPPSHGNSPLDSQSPSALLACSHSTMSKDSLPKNTMRFSHAWIAAIKRPTVKPDPHRSQTLLCLVYMRHRGPTNYHYQDDRGHYRCMHKHNTPP